MIPRVHYSLEHSAELHVLSWEQNSCPGGRTTVRTCVVVPNDAVSKPLMGWPRSGIAFRLRHSLPRTDLAQSVKRFTRPRSVHCSSWPKPTMVPLAVMSVVFCLVSRPDELGQTVMRPKESMGQPNLARHVYPGLGSNG
ncbi:hypothetical protein ACH5RR_029777 [Cinchona calisaya]|uniref:Uncharacterized protein n=1 Tax=Cinchona calisaya TaxID=153742 RepID=A0ABD2YU29_9GENT